RLCELDDVDPVLTESRPNRRCRVRLTTRDLKLDECENFLCHMRECSRGCAPLLPSCRLRNDQSIFLTWSNPSSTGTCRSKMSTSTFSFWASVLTSTISPSKSDSGPEVTLTDSPRENWACDLAAGPPPAPWVWRIRSTSA